MAEGITAASGTITSKKKGESLEVSLTLSYINERCNCSILLSSLIRQELSEKKS